MKEAIISAALVEEIYQHLIKEPYANVAQLIAKMHAEIDPQVATQQPEPPPPPMTPEQ